MTAPGVQDEIVNVLHFEAPEPLDVNSLDAAFQPAWHTLVVQETQSIFLQDHVTYTELDGSAGIDIPWTGGANTNPSSLFPMNACLCYSWRTLAAGRSFRGRSYIGPTGPNRIDTTRPDLVDPGFLPNGTTRGNNFISAMDSAGFPLVIASYKLSSKLAVDHVKINPRICTQRRRVNSR
jgi:hypothetical protein